ncbi:MAG: DHH family phosphoesterase [Candidatus Aenigmarchaeota archaeon]|nr:DHH family phosphoesterase [Candidatus Aenigmarchaeota archaeon]
MKTTILTHSDCDGICAGAVALSMFPGSDVFFTKPVSLLKDLGEIRLGNRIVVCDIALTERDVTSVLDFFEDSGLEIMYFDHHPISKENAKRLKKIAKVYVTGEASSSELVYRYFQDSLPRERVWAAIYGAIGDYSANTQFVKNRLINWDARALYFEASTIVLGIKHDDFDTYDAKRRIVKTVASGQNPSDVAGLVQAAKEVVNKEFDLYELVKKEAKKSGEVGYVKDLPMFGFRGPSALFASTATNTKIGISVHSKQTHMDITMRIRDYKIPANEFCSRAAAKVGGSGGGHPQAAGARIPPGKMSIFIKELNSLLKEYGIQK